VTVTVSLVVIFALVLFLLLREGRLGYGSAFTASGFGFFLASTGAAAPINTLTASVIDAISSAVNSL
jgi:preprotein translocase subunit SecG